MVLKSIEEIASNVALQVRSSALWTLAKREIFNKYGYPKFEYVDCLTCKEINISD